MKSKFLNFSVLFAIIVMFSCKEESDDISMIYTNGAFISCEGNYGSGNASVSFYSYVSDSIYNNIFYSVNDRAVGDVLQSITIYKGNTYLTVNNSNKVEVVDVSGFNVKGVITGVPSPRYLVANENTAYVSCWGDNTVKIVDLTSNQVTGSIPVSSGPDKMAISKNKLYIANSGGWGVDSLISVVDMNTNKVIKSIEVKYAPVDLVVDSQGDIWVLSFGKIIYGPEDPYPILEETASKLYKIDAESDLVVSVQTLFDSEHPMQLEIDNSGVLYFGGGYTFGGIYSLDVNSGSGLPVKIIEDYAYGFNVDPNTGELFVTIANSYTSGGTLSRYSSDGSLIGNFVCGIIPNGAAFTSE